MLQYGRSGGLLYYTKRAVQAHPAMTLTTTAALLLALLLLPLLILLWASESRQQRAKRWRRSGLTQQAIADRLGCSRTTVRRLLAA
jgi:ABC-type spermidine/putrescine transport system permease subunit II